MKAGFLGCFGVLAAVLVTIFALVLWSGTRSTATDARVAAGTARASDYLPYCAAGLAQAKAEHGVRGLDYDYGTDPQPLGGRAVSCPVRRAGRAGRLTLDIACARVLDAACVRARSLTLGTRKVF